LIILILLIIFNDYIYFIFHEYFIDFFINFFINFIKCSTNNNINLFFHDYIKCSTNNHINFIFHDLLIIILIYLTFVEYNSDKISVAVDIIDDISKKKC